MICKSNQQMIDTILRLKTDDNKQKTINLIDHSKIVQEQDRYNALKVSVNLWTKVIIKLLQLQLQ